MHLHHVVLGACDDLVLQVFAQVTEIITVSGHTDDKVTVLFWVLLSGMQSLSIHDIKLDVMSIQLEVGAHQLDQLLKSLVIGQ